MFKHRVNRASSACVACPDGSPWLMFILWMYLAVSELDASERNNNCDVEKCYSTINAILYSSLK